MYSYLTLEKKKEYIYIAALINNNYNFLHDMVNISTCNNQKQTVQLDDPAHETRVTFLI